MIADSYEPNNTDGSWFIAELVAGPFGKFNYINLYIITLLYKI